MCSLSDTLLLTGRLCAADELAKRLVAAEQRAARKHEELALLRHSSCAERKALQQQYSRLRCTLTCLACEAPAHPSLLRHLPAAG